MGNTGKTNTSNTRRCVGSMPIMKTRKISAMVIWAADAAYKRRRLTTAGFGMETELHLTPRRHLEQDVPGRNRKRWYDSHTNSIAADGIGRVSGTATPKHSPYHDWQHAFTSDPVWTIFDNRLGAMHGLTACRPTGGGACIKVQQRG
jgi:hypothetical protein